MEYLIGFVAGVVVAFIFAVIISKRKKETDGKIIVYETDDGPYPCLQIPSLDTLNKKYLFLEVTKDTSH